MSASDERIAAILTDRSRFEARVRALWTEAAKAGDELMVALCRQAIGGGLQASEECARVLAEAENCGDDVFAKHGRQIAREDAKMPKEILDVLYSGRRS